MNTRLETQTIDTLILDMDARDEMWDDMEFLAEHLLKAYRAGFAHGQAAGSKLESKEEVN